MKRNELNRRMQRGEFRVEEFQNPSGQTAFRVYGWKIEGDGFRARVRENFKTHEEALARRQQLEIQSTNMETAARPVVTRLTPEQAAVAESAFLRLGPQGVLELPSAIEYWLKHGRKQSLVQSPPLVEAFKQFSAWLDTCELRELSRKNLRRRAQSFVNAFPHMRVADVTQDTIDAYLSKRAVSPKSKDNDRRAVSRFFSWSCERPRRWTAVNPCRGIKIAIGDEAPPAILSLDECKAMLHKAESFEKGKLAPYVAVCLFGGLRPFEASRLDWQAVNLEDKEIRLEATQTKTGNSRTVAICPTLLAWLQAYKGKPFYPSNWRKDFDEIKMAAGYGGRVDGETEDGEDKLKPWPVDVMRHTAASHYFRQTGSYGQTAEQFGNSEAIIKKHYQGRVNSEDTKAFYAILPAAKPARSRKASKPQVQAVAVKA